MGYFPIMLGLGAALFMWFALVSQSLKTKFQAVLAVQSAKKQQEVEIWENFEQLFSALQSELGTDHETLTDLLILRNQADSRSMDWYEEIVKELEKIFDQVLVSQALGKKIEYFLRLIQAYKPIWQQYQKAVFFYEQLLASGAARVPAKLLGYGKM